MDFKQNYGLKSFLNGVQMESRWIYGVHVEAIWNLCKVQQLVCPSLVSCVSTDILLG